MRILMVGSTLGDAYGQERVVRLSAQALMAAGHEVYFLADHFTGPLPLSGGKTAPLSAVSLPGLSSLESLSSPAWVASFLRTLNRVVAAISPDIIHLIDAPDFRVIDALAEHAPLTLTAHTVAPTCPASSRLLSFGGVCERKSGWLCLDADRTQHCLDPLRGIVRKAHAVHHYLLKRFMDFRFRRVGAISEYVFNTLLKDGWDQDRLAMVPNPVVVPKNVMPLPDLPRNLLVFASRLVPLKGLAVLLNALKELTSLDWKLFVFGTGVEEKRLKAVVENSFLKDRVSFFGRVSSETLFRTLKGAAGYIQPNTGPEGFGLSAAEAAALGTPVITSRIPAFTEIFSENHLVVPSHKDSLREAVEKLLTNPTYADELRKSGEEIAKKFSIERHFEAQMNVYRSCIKNENLEIPLAVSEL